MHATCMQAHSNAHALPQVHTVLALSHHAHAHTNMQLRYKSALIQALIATRKRLQHAVESHQLPAAERALALAAAEGHVQTYFNALIIKEFRRVLANVMRYDKVSAETHGAALACTAADAPPAVVLAEAVAQLPVVLAVLLAVRYVLLVLRCSRGLGEGRLAAGGGLPGLFEVEAAASRQLAGWQADTMFMEDAEHAVVQKRQQQQEQGLA